MLKGELVRFGRFEWWSEKENANIKNHKDANNNGISFRDILPIFDDPYFRNATSKCLFSFTQSFR